MSNSQNYGFNDNQQIVVSDKKSNGFIIAWGATTIASILFTLISFFSHGTGVVIAILCGIVAHVLMVITRVRFKSDKTVKALFWVDFAVLVLQIFLIIILLYVVWAVASFCGGCVSGEILNNPEARETLGELVTNVANAG